MSRFPKLESIQGPRDIKRMSIAQLEQLAQEMRDAICDQVSRSGGHLAPNLGVVELTLALHYVFDFSYDRLLFDVGHQSIVARITHAGDNAAGLGQDLHPGITQVFTIGASPGLQ